VDEGGEDAFVVNLARDAWTGSRVFSSGDIDFLRLGNDDEGERRQYHSKPRDIHHWTSTSSHQSLNASDNFCPPRIRFAEPGVGKGRVEEVGDDELFSEQFNSRAMGRRQQGGKFGGEWKLRRELMHSFGFDSKQSGNTQEDMIGRWGDGPRGMDLILVRPVCYLVDFVFFPFLFSSFLFS
jgi:hypothetical protein